jgi:hypothetical protein
LQIVHERLREALRTEGLKAGFDKVLKRHRPLEHGLD